MCDDVSRWCRGADTVVGGKLKLTKATRTPQPPAVVFNVASLCATEQHLLCARRRVVSHNSQLPKQPTFGPAGCWSERGSS